MKIRHIVSLSLLWTCQLALFGQAQLGAGGDFNPANPGDPQAPVLKHELRLTAYPAGSGTFNVSESQRVSEGDSVRLYAYPNTGFVFRGWMQGDSVLSATSPYSYRMGTADATVTAVFAYSPTNPANPGRNHWDASTGNLIVDDFTPGRLSSAISEALGNDDESQITQLIISGELQSYDFGFSNYSSCTLIDLSRAYGWSSIPSYSFYGSSSLASVILPPTTESVEYYAFYDCSALADITCYALVPPVVDDYAFSGIAEGAVLHVPAAAIPLYAEAEGWKDFTILPLQDEVRNLEVSLPADAADGRYKDMTLELLNAETGQRQRYVISDRVVYTFNSLMKNSTFNVYVRNQAGTELGRIEGVAVGEDDVQVAFASLLQPRDVSLSLLTPDGVDVTAQSSVTWLDSAGTYLKQGALLAGQLGGTRLAYRVTLPQVLAMQYVQPAEAAYTVADGDNNIVCTLAPIGERAISGSVKDAATGQPISGAVVSVSQMLNGRYSKAFNVRTDAAGAFTQTVFDAPTSITASASDYVSLTVDSVAFGEGGSVGELALRPITGVTVTTTLTYTGSVAEGETAETQDFYADYANVTYSIYNVTQGKAVTQFNVQYPQIVLLEEAAVGDVLRITASSKTSAFVPVVAEAMIDEANRAAATFPIVELGGIRASFTSTDNSAVVGLLYGGNGQLIKKYSYSDAQLSITQLADGSYTLVTMANSSLFNSILNLSEFAASGLTEGSDYVQNAVEVKSGAIAVVSNEMIPALDESKLYYTGDNTSFTVNKTSIVAGNYLTLKGRINFKSEYASSVGDVSMVVDLPESCSFVENSVMVGTKVSGYTIEGNRLTIPIDDISKDIKFCVIPRVSGSFYISGAASFTIDGNKVHQPIGDSQFTVEEMSLTVPETVCLPRAFVTGVAVGNSDVEIYDNGVLVGKTKALANGVWATVCELDFPYTLTTHRINAKFKTPDGLNLESETKDCFYDKSAIVLSDVTMMTSDEEIVFDFINGEVSSSSYTYDSSNFTFLINFTNNDTAYVSNVKLYVNTMDGGVVRLYPVYNKKKDVWVASSTFVSGPVNVSVTFNNKAKAEIDNTILDDCNEDIVQTLSENAEIEEKANSFMQGIDAELAKDIPNYETVSALNDSINAIYGQTAIDVHFADSIYNEITALINVEHPETDEEYVSLVDDYIESLIPEGMPTPEEQITALDELPSIMPVQATGGYQTPKFSYVKGAGHQTANDAYLLSDAWEIEGFGGENPSTNSLTLSNAETGDKVIVDWGSQLPNAGTSTDELRTFEECGIDYLNNLMFVNDLQTIGLEEVIKYDLRMRNVYSKLWQDWLRNGRSAAIATYWKEKSLAHLDASSRSANILAATKRIQGFNNGFQNLLIAGHIGENWLGCRDWDDVIDKAQELCDEDEAKKIAGIAEALKKEYGLNSIWNVVGEVGLQAIGVGAGLASWATGGTSLAITVACFAVGNKLGSIRNEFMKENEELMLDVQRMIMDSNKCDADSSDFDNDIPIPIPPLHPLIPKIDPAGYVYEAVSSNRLEGVTATCYYKETVEDMYGDLHENVVLWDAAEYAQENPLFTDENGMYRWDVPQGLWQVKFEKDGYQTTYSEWLPVPPPQLEVNIAMVQNRQPEVKAARAYESGIEVEFDKYMQPETMTTDNIFATVGGEKVEGSITLMNAENAYEGEGESYVSKVRFVPATPFLSTDEVVLSVSRKVKSYAGIQMESDYSQAFDIEKEVTSIVSDSIIKVAYNGEKTIRVSALPYDAAIGRKLVVRSSSPMIASVSADTLTLNENGQAELILGGELPGAAVVTFALQGADLTGRSNVQVVDESQLYTAAPVASRASGSAVYRNTGIELSSETADAVIYYTTDGSCPCDEATRLVYDGPIAVTADMTIKAMAVGPGMDESEVAEFSYTIKTTTLGLDLNEGWTWVSHDLEAPVAATELSENALRIVSQTAELVNDPVYGLTGNLTELVPEQAYKVQASAATSHTLSGYEHNGALPIELKAGWNWIGYPVSQTMTLDEALANMTPDEEDYIAGQEGFAQFADGQWTGTLQTLTPGAGYMYHSQADKQLVYNTAIVSRAQSLYGKGLQMRAPWAVDKYRYPNVMCLVADVFVDGMKADAGEYSVGAFCGTECRGIGTYVDGKLMMNIYGEGGEKITFMAVDNATEQAYTISESELFAETLLGSIRLPYRLNIGDVANGINTAETGISVWPAVVSDRLYVECSRETVDKVIITDLGGATRLVAADVVSGGAVNVSALNEGVYVVTVRSGSDVFYKKIVKSGK